MTTLAIHPAPGVRQLGLLMQWQLRRQAQYLPLLVLVQILVSVATILGYGLLVGDVPHEAALYLATGAPTVTLVMVGLVMAPQMVAQAKTEGSLDWIRTLPVPRPAFLIADLLVWTVLALPGMVLGVLVGQWRFDLDLSLAWWVAPAAFVVSLISAAVGYAMATLLPPQLAHLMTQVLVFVVLLFSPVSYPAERMPGWLQGVHSVLPIEPMAQVVRGGLAHEDFSVPGRSVAVLVIWTVASLAGATWSINRRA